MRNLGSLKGPLLIFGGVYGNFQALKEIMRLANRLDIAPGNVICTGNSVGYFAQPEECIRLLMKRRVTCIRGYSEQLIKQAQTSEHPDLLNDSQWFNYTINQLSRESISWLEDLPEHLKFNYYGKNYLVVHGSYDCVTDNIYKSTPWSVKAKSFRESGADVILAGHSDLPFSHLRIGKMWLNSGAIGLPANDGTSRVWYLYLNFNEEWGETEFEHRFLEYDFEETLRLAEINDLPSCYVNTLKTGLWETNENLPSYEAAFQGKDVPL